MPQLSIITVNLNNLQGLKKTMQSVFEQTFTDYEYIIIDGGSTDGSKEYIEAHSSKLAYWVSEKDGGIYDALNKGSSKSRGKYLHHLNSGDRYYSRNVLEEVFDENREADFFFGNMMLEGYGLKEYPDRLTFDFFLRDAVPHQATFIKREFFLDNGGFTASCKMGGDYKFFLEAVYLRQCSYMHLNKVISNYDMSGISSVGTEELKREFEDIRKKTVPNLISEFSILYEIRRRYELLKNSRGVKAITTLKDIIGKKRD